MKRYTFALDSNGHWQRRESPDGEYYRRDDLIAAGPWRTDIENAPRDRDVLMCFQHQLGKLFYVTAHADLGYRKACIAWAEINQPENTP